MPEVWGPALATVAGALTLVFRRSLAETAIEVNSRTRQRFRGEYAVHTALVVGIGVGIMVIGIGGFLGVTPFPLVLANFAGTCLLMLAAYLRAP